MTPKCIKKQKVIASEARQSPNDCFYLISAAYHHSVEVLPFGDCHVAPLLAMTHNF